MRAINKPGTSIARMAGSHGKIVPLDENVIPQSARLKERHPGICFFSSSRKRPQAVIRDLPSSKDNATPRQDSG